MRRTLCRSVNLHRDPFELPDQFSRWPIFRSLRRRKTPHFQRELRIAQAASGALRRPSQPLWSRKNRTASVTSLVMQRKVLATRSYCGARGLRLYRALPERRSAVNQCQLIGASLREGSKRRSGKIREMCGRRAMPQACALRSAQNAATQCEACTVSNSPERSASRMKRRVALRGSKCYSLGRRANSCADAWRRQSGGDACGRRASPSGR